MSDRSSSDSRSSIDRSTPNANDSKDAGLTPRDADAPDPKASQTPGVFETPGVWDATNAEAHPPPDPADPATAETVAQTPDPVAEVPNHVEPASSPFDQKHGRASSPSHGGDAQAGDAIRYFGEYELLEEIARGGMGVVYKARQTSLNRIVALKMILAGQLASEADVRRFRTEAEAAANLDHPGIVPIYEVGEHEGQHYFSMAYVEGESLADRVKDGPLPPKEAAEIVKQIAEAIAYAHGRGVIHRDLKPANVLLSLVPGPSSFAEGPSGVKDADQTTSATSNSAPTSDPAKQMTSDKGQLTKVTDFGLAKRAETEDGLTHTGQILGTPGYMPPEQAAGKTQQVGPLSDVYSLGAILYCLLTGRPPFQSANVMDTLKQVVEKEPISSRQLNADVPIDLDTICLRGLQKDPQRRFASAQAMADDLGRYCNGMPIVSRRVGRMTRSWMWCRRHRGIALLMLVISLLLSIGAIGGLLTAMHERGLRENIELQLARQHAVIGIRLAEEGETADAMFAFTMAIETAPTRAHDFHDAVRRNITAWKPHLHTLAVAKDWATLAVSSDGRWAIISVDNEVALYDAAKRVRRRMPDHGLIAAFSPGGEFFALPLKQPTSRGRRKSRRWELQIYRTEGVHYIGSVFPSINPLGLDLSADGQTALVSSDNRTEVWKLGSSSPDAATAIESGYVLNSLSPSGKRFATTTNWKTGQVGEVHVWNAETGKRIGDSLNHGFRVSAVIFDDDGSTLWTAAYDGTIRKWNIDTGESHVVYSFGLAITAMTINPVSRSCLLAFGDRTLRLFDLDERRVLDTLPEQPSPISFLGLTADSSTALLGGCGPLLTVEAGVLGRVSTDSEPRVQNVGG